MNQKKVKIIGLSVNNQVGILQACNIGFNPDNKLITTKGAVGQGKSTLTKNVQLCTQGTETLTDKKLYGKIDTEVQLLDGDLNVWVGCKSDKTDKLTYSLYTKDQNGKIIREPVIDGVKATPAAYLKALQTELTWRLDELTSENPTVQKKILLSMYQPAFKKLGVIFDKKNPEYENSILHKIELAESIRNEKDAIRKQVGGIKEDLKAQGFDVERPATIPEEINISEIDTKIKEQERLKTIEETQSTSGKDLKLQQIKTEVSELTNKAVAYNSRIKSAYDTELKDNETEIANRNSIEESLKNIETEIQFFNKIGVADIDENIIRNLVKLPELKIIEKPKYIEFSDYGKIITDSHPVAEANDILLQIIDLRKKYQQINSEEVIIDVSKFITEIDRLELEKKNAIEINKIVQAVHSWHEWSNADANVKELKKEYVKLLAKVDTGVDGLKIVPEENENKLDIFMMYNGSYDPEYFGNKDKKMIKLSAYSGTQKPVICLLIQNYLLSQKPKAMRYMFIDNVPMDKRTISLLENMCTDLDLTIFLNITGDFDKNNIQDGEILVDGGEVFFNKSEDTPF